MAYAGSFHRLVVIGRLFNVEDFNFTLSIVPLEDPSAVEAVSAQLLADVAAKVEAWFPDQFDADGVQFTSSVTLTAIKLNRINAAGHYQDQDAMTHEYPAPIAGTASGAFPAQLAVAATLRTARSRGRGARGRFYLPQVAPVGVMGAGGTMSAGNALSIAEGAAKLIVELNNTYFARNLGLGVLMRVGVASNVGTGVFEEALSVDVGRVVDTIRSRRSSLPEDYQTVVIDNPV
jgi:hypothetical protein